MNNYMQSESSKEVKQGMHGRWCFFLMWI